LSSLAYAGYILALIGGIIILIVGIITLFSSPFVGILNASFLSGIDAFARGILAILLGIVAIIGSKYVSTLAWGIVLIIVGIIAGDLGGALVFFGALLGLISTVIYKT
jgi:hypothetical protein